MFAATNALNAGGRQLVRCALQQKRLINSNVISGPPQVRVSFAEKAILGLTMSASVMFVPMYVLVNLKVYTAGQPSS